MIGAAVASVVTVTGNAVYGHSLRRTGERVREAVPIAGRWPALTAPLGPRAAEPTARRRARPRWQRLTPGRRSAVFVAILAVVTAVELVAGRPLSDLVQGGSARGTSVGDTLTGGSLPATPPRATITETVTPKIDRGHADRRDYRSGRHPHRDPDGHHVAPPPTDADTDDRLELGVADAAVRPRPRRRPPASS